MGSLLPACQALDYMVERQHEPIQCTFFLFKGCSLVRSLPLPSMIRGTGGVENTDIGL